MTAVETVPSRSGIRVRVTGPIAHRCPYVDEVDEGQVAIGWTTHRVTFELHSLADHLATYADQRLSHEDLVVALTRSLAGLGCADITVIARFTTAGLDVEVSGALPVASDGKPGRP